MSALSEKATAYHSALVALCPQDGSGVELTICSGPKASKFPKGDSTHFIDILFEGSKHQLILENEGCMEALTGYNGQVVRVDAQGDRGGATLTVLDAQAAPAQRPPAAQRPAARSAAQPQRPAARTQQPAQPAAAPPRERQPVTTDGAMKLARAYVAKSAVLLRLCLDASAYVLKKIGGEHTDETWRSLAASLYIDAQRNGSFRVEDLPTLYPGEAKPPVPPAAAQQPPPTRQHTPSDDQPSPQRAAARPGQVGYQHPKDPDLDAGPDDLPF